MARYAISHGVLSELELTETAGCCSDVERNHARRWPALKAWGLIAVILGSRLFIAPHT